MINLCHILAKQLFYLNRTSIGPYRKWIRSKVKIHKNGTACCEFKFHNTERFVQASRRLVRFFVNKILKNGKMCFTCRLKYFERYHKLISKLQHYVQARTYHFNAVNVNTDATSIQKLDSFKSNVLLLILNNSAILRGIADRYTS